MCEAYFSIVILSYNLLIREIFTQAHSGWSARIMRIFPTFPCILCGLVIKFLPTGFK